MPFLVVATATGCAPPAAVGRYATSAKLVTATLPDVADQLSAACRRSESYRLRRVTPGWYEADTLATGCAGRDSALRAVRQVNRALAAYFAAIGSLAGQNDAALGGSVAALGAAASDLPGLDGDQVRAVSALARFATGKASGGYRRKQLRAAIAEQNANVQTVTAALHTVIDRDFAQYVRNDGAAQTAFYRAALTESTTREPLTAILVRDAYDQRQAEVRDRADAVRALARAVDAIGRGHQALYDARDHLGARELLDAVTSSARALDAAVAKVNKAF